MPYSISAHRRVFEDRASALLAQSRRANKLDEDLRDVRDMVFQCAVFQTSAALETYLRLIVESWFQKLKSNNKGEQIPHNVRARIFAKLLGPSFENYALSGDEAKIFRSLEANEKLWDLMKGSPAIPQYMTGMYIHESAAYPSNKNLRKLFLRLGMGGIHDQVSAVLHRDAEDLIEGFQSVRTNIAHSSPDDITIDDVKRLVGDIAAFVRAVDRIFYRHVLKHGGPSCWS